jgi:hypothetical protein
VKSEASEGSEDEAPTRKQRIKSSTDKGPSELRSEEDEGDKLEAKPLALKVRTVPLGCCITHGIQRSRKASETNNMTSKSAAKVYKSTVS